MDPDDKLISAPVSETTRKRPYATAVEQQGETAGVTSTGTTSPRPENGKRRRRKLSCETCQRLKCRCDYDPVSRTCHRCKTLRRPCSITDDDYHITLQSQPEVAEDPNVELKRRLQAVEGSVTEIKMMIRDVQSTLSSSRNKDPVGNSYANSRRTPQSSEATHDNAEPEDISDPADAGIGSAPAIVMRTMATHLAGVRRRVLEHFNSDLIQLGLLDESSADTLIRLFYRHRDSGLLVRDIGLSHPSKELRKASPFLHAVCCLHGMPYGPEDWPAVSTRSDVYQQVRSMLGQALLASPLPLDEINAILLMSVYSNQSPVVSDSPVDYIDSWLLTGYCAQQAMLSISFSTIVENVRRGNPTDEDRRAIRLWASVCLHHLHWAVTTGRPSTIPAPYLNQCNILLSLFEATVHEGMVVAEILLYTALNRKLTHHSYLDANGECAEFAAWKQKWCHLFALPRSSAFKLSYHSAYLILAVRSLEDFNNGRATEDLLSPQPANQPLLRHHADGQPRDQAHSIALRFAVQILETFLEMSTLLRNEIPIYLHMCISYAALVIAQYWRNTPPAARASADAVLELLTALEEWAATSHSGSLVTSYSAGLAKRRVQASVGDDHRHNTQGYVARSGHEAPPPQAEDDAAAGSPLYSAAEGLLGLGGGGVPVVDAEASRLSSVNGHVLDMPDLGLELTTPDFPSMEDFFGGGFLDFMR
ncbi:hypothetical protein CONLIGDRAFT_634496 [Coniochaeta ligniaria NRRL 30616]|uniref:Zn(2)-C6 fungal-type domain-containing protein n=1 Tax=Coniochaeta ligniaria NRRL 30616 TaxID=1408157 RepID=A0A1J7JFZ4_9PEZI|nr:hypothetical protein CONLIGDRAFT_634496 [Coniochaeta ligniaria NRRL 30616]